ncbi:MAG: hypothetical protein AAF998_06880 [Bacteroidota bacterium]
MFEKEELYTLNGNLLIQVLYPHNPKLRQIHILDGQGKVVGMIRKTDEPNGKTTYTLEVDEINLKKNDPQIAQIEEFIISKHFMEYQRGKRINWLKKMQKHRKKDRRKHRNR